jgi:hypothetical protein
LASQLKSILYYIDRLDDYYASTPAVPLFMNGRPSRIQGVWRKTLLPAAESTFAVSAKRLVEFIASVVLLRASAAYLIEFDPGREVCWGGE